MTKTINKEKLVKHLTNAHNRKTMIIKDFSTNLPKDARCIIEYQAVCDYIQKLIQNINNDKI